MSSCASAVDYRQSVIEALSQAAHAQPSTWHTQEVRRLMSGVIFAILAGVFALASAYLLYFVIGTGELFGYALVFVFALGSAVAVRSARGSFIESRNRRTRRE